jgi:O-antigen ligase
MKIRLLLVISLILLSFIFGGANLQWADTDYFPYALKLRYILVLIPLGIILTLRFMQNQSIQIPMKTILTVWFWFFFVFTVLITAFIKVDTSYIIDGLWFLIGVPLIFFIILPDFFQENANRLIAAALFIGNIPYIILLFRDEPDFLAFRSGGRIIANSATVGAIAGMCALGIIIMIYYSMKKRGLRYKFRLFVLIPTFLVVSGAVLLSRSRTAFLASVVSIGITFLTTATTKERIKIISTTFLLGVVILLLPIDLSWATEGIQSKFEEKLKEDNLFSGRTEIWQRILENANLAGYTDEYQEQHIYHIEGRFFAGKAHNSFLDVLASHGWLATFLFVLFCFSSIFHSYRYSRLNKDTSYSIVPFVVTIYFWIISLSATVIGSIGSGITLAFLLAIGVVFRDFRQRAKARATVAVQRWSQDSVSRSAKADG